MVATDVDGKNCAVLEMTTIVDITQSSYTHRTQCISTEHVTCIDRIFSSANVNINVHCLSVLFRFTENAYVFDVSGTGNYKV